MPGIPKGPAKGTSLEAGRAGNAWLTLVSESSDSCSLQPENLPHQPPPEACQRPGDDGGSNCEGMGREKTLLPNETQAHPQWESQGKISRQPRGSAE